MRTKLMIMGYQIIRAIRKSIQICKVGEAKRMYVIKITRE